MSSRIVQLLPEVDRLITITSTPQSLTTLQVEACRATKSSGDRWQQVHFQLKELQNCDKITSLQKLQLASCERYFFGFFNSSYKNYESMYQSALELLSFDDLNASLNLLSASAKCCASAGDFEQSMKLINQAFEWAHKHTETSAFLPVFAAAVFVCNRMTRHQFAKKCADHCIDIAEREHWETELQMALLLSTNSARLAGLEHQDLQHTSRLRLLEQGHIRYDALNQFLLTVDVALHALEQAQPDCRVAGHALAIASELSCDANDYAIAQYLLALSKYNLATGQRKNAKDAIVEAAYVLPEVDFSLTKRIHQTLAHLGMSHVRRKEEQQIVPLSKLSWKRFADHINTAIANTKMDSYITA